MSAEYTLEQQFAIKSFQQQVNQMSREQAQGFLIKMYEHLLMKDNMYKELMKKDWGLGNTNQGLNNEQV